ESGALRLEHTVRGVESPSFLALDRQRRFLFAVNEVSQQSGTVSSFAVDPGDGNLTPLSKQESHGTSPCYVSLDPTERYAMVANYGTGVLSVYPVGDDGRLGVASHVVQHEGRGPGPRRQEGP